MTVEEYERLIPILEKNEYRKWNMKLYNEDSATAKDSLTTKILTEKSNVVIK